MNLATLADQHLEKFGEIDRLIFEGNTWTNKALHEETKKFAGALQGLGIQPDDKVVVIMPNCPEVLVTFPAIWRAGATIIPVLFLLEAHEVAYILQNSKAKAVVTSPELVPKIEQARKGIDTLQHVITIGDAGDAPDGCESFAALSAAATPLETAVDRAKDDVAVILYTSGTTGNPKGVMQTHNNLYANTMNGVRTTQLVARNKGEDPVAAVEEGDTSLLVLPLAHSFGLSVLIGGYMTTAKAVLMRWFDAETVLKLLDEYSVDRMAGVPTMFVYMMHHPDADKYNITVENWTVGGSPMPQEQKEAFERKFGGIMRVGYGLSESSPTISYERDDLPRKPGSAGVPIEGVEVKVVDEEGNEVPRGEIGEIIAKGENITPGYYEMPDKTAETFKDGWLFTGDMGIHDEDGYLFIMERKKDLIIRGGFNIYPKDVEEVIHQMDGIQEVAVVGMPDEFMGEEVVAFIVKAAGADLTAEMVTGHCQEHLAKYKTPRFVEFISEMPKTTIGKIQKRELRTLATETVKKPAAT